MKRVLTAVVLIPVVLAIVFRAPLWLFALVVAAIIVLALHEYLGIVEAAEISPFRRVAYIEATLPVFLLLCSIVMIHLPPHSRHYWSYSEGDILRTCWQLTLISPVIFGIPLVFRKDMNRGLVAVAASILGVIYISWSLSMLIVLRADLTKSVLVVFILFSVWAGDIAAYYVGRTFGRHKLAPVVSPNKSWEGAIASVLASVGIAILVLYFRNVLDGWFSYPGIFRWQNDTLAPVWPPSLAHALILGVLTNVAAQFGDLFESALKRGARVKDSGTLLPGHGGILDRIDALLFAIPVVVVYTNLA
jgi:phosphatidate cytidylyltransferase